MGSVFEPGVGIPWPLRTPLDAYIVAEKYDAAPTLQTRVYKFPNGYQVSVFLDYDCALGLYGGDVIRYHLPFKLERYNEQDLVLALLGIAAGPNLGQDAEPAVPVPVF